MAMDYATDFPGVLPKLVDLAHNRSVVDITGSTYYIEDEAKLFFRAFFQFWEVMTCLGLSMILSSWSLPLFLNTGRTRSLMLGGVLFVICLSVSNIAIVTAQSGLKDLSKPPQNEFPHMDSTVHNVFELCGRVFLYPGKLFRDWEMMIYPVFPWIGYTFLGMGFGHVFHQDPSKAIRWMGYLGLVMIVAYMFIRGYGGKLNYRGSQRGEHFPEPSQLMQFFIQTKYPPDWCYAFITLPVIFTLLNLLNLTSVFHEENMYIRPLLVFGRVPLFFYLVHMWLIQMTEAFMRIPSPPTGKFPLYGVPVLWVVIVSIMYLACARFLAFKQTTEPSSLWRMF